MHAKANIAERIDEGICFSPGFCTGLDPNNIQVNNFCRHAYIFSSLQVLLNQIVLGPCVIAVVFAWNNLWQGKVSELPNKYQKDALPTLFFGKKLFSIGLCNATI